MTFILLLTLLPFYHLSAQELFPGNKLPEKYTVDRRIDNMGYWKKMAQLGLVPVTPPKWIPEAVYKSSFITDASVSTPDSPDIPVTQLNSTQSENSVFISPNNRLNLLNSNNSSINPYPGYFFGADDFFSFDGGITWDGQVHGAGGYNMGDPSTAINSLGRWYVGFIHSGGGQALAYSNDEGVTWKVRAIASPPDLMGGLLDKSHLWIDNSPTSPYKSNMYDGWTVITGPGDGKLQVSRSTDKGLAWQIPVTISDSVYAKSHNQGINIATGPNGEVYAIWSIYDAFPSDEKAIGFARSFNGGQTWQPGKRILDSIRGIRIHGVGKEMRVNSFPSMTVDISNSPWRGTIYAVWANLNYPGINSGNNVDIYMIRSADSGSTWSTPVRINQDLPQPGKKHYFPWITCDPANGNLAMISYDDRDTPASQVEAWVATSTDGGENWQDFRVSDVAFTPSPVTGLSDNYFGDYLGIAAREGLIYPCWTDNRTGAAMAYVSPFRLGPAPGEPYIAFQAFHYNDSVTGNGNGKVEYGETAQLGLSLRNMGDVPDSLVNVTLHTDSPYLHFTDSTEFFGNFGASQSLSIYNAFSFSISDTVPNETRIIITVYATDKNDSTFISYFTLKALAPDLLIIDFLVEDSSSNNNHSFDPAENCRVKIRLKNPTLYPATFASCQLESLQDFVTVSTPVQLLGEIGPGEVRDAIFEVQVDTVTTGTPASFRAIARFTGQEKIRIFQKKIGLIFEDWESGDVNHFNWQFSGNSNWRIDTIMAYEGKYCLRSGSVGKNQTSVFSINSRALTYDSISFYRKVSSEARYDYLNFYIDDDLVGKWAGEVDWSRVVFPVTPGYHDFKWEYAKDPELSIGLDAAFVDFIEFPSVQYTTAEAGKDAIIYECQVYACNGIATYYDSLQWITTGTGIFANPNAAHTRYTPSEADKAAGLVTLILKVYGSTVNDLPIDSMNLTILPQPTAYAGPDAGVCKGESFRIVSASASNYTSVFWGTDGSDGTFSDPAILFPEYIPGPSDLLKGYADLLLVSYAGNNDACGIDVDTLRLTLYDLPVIPLPASYTRCTGYSADLDATTPGAVSYDWNPGNQSSAVIRVDSTGTGIGTATLEVTVIGEHGCSATKSTRVSFEDCPEKIQSGSVYFRVYPSPAQSQAYIELYSSSEIKVSYSLANASGSIVMNSEEFLLSGQKIIPLAIEHLSQGTYLLTLKSDQSVTTRLVIF
ncbi:MAG: T9SS type A sorting domain-containing protein [Bacteroidales bacterium]|nr:T9SS type A sorting domain-containing protein [Bacteroidales bacterium]